MKKLILAVMGAACLVFIGQAAWAGVANTPHDVTGLGTAYARMGVCSACHIPHKAAGKRLWPASLSTNPAHIASRGEVGLMCTYCHDPVGGLVAGARSAYPFKDATATTHGLRITGFLPTGDVITASGLPYTNITGQTIIQCVSCHNVHDNTQMPFLNRNIDSLCSHCHQNRQFVGGAASTAVGAWGNFYGETPTGANSNPGSHPVGTDVYTDTSGAGNSPITWTVIGLQTWGGPGSHNLGPHLATGASTTPVNGQGMTCNTCHTVHGVQTEGTGGSAPYEDVLPLNQGNAGGRGTGAGTAANLLCEACHRGRFTGYAGTQYPNPGATARYTHPVDDYNDLDLGVTAVPANWPVGSGAVVAPAIICESCHTPHPRSGMTNGVIGAGTNSHILRAQDLVFCEQCHTATPTGHHPVGAGLLGARFVDAAIGNNDANLTCSDCHNGSGAHNWTTQRGVGLDANWEPLDNGRTQDTGVAAQGIAAAGQVSKECIDCHTNANAHNSPVRAAAGGYLNHSPQLQYSGEGSHYIGAMPTSWALGGPANSNFTTANWATGGWSRRGSDASALGAFVCESCHELEWDKNGSHNAMLLEQYLEGAAESRNAFCEGCHSPAGATGQAHPQTGDTVSKAQLNGLSPVTLVTAAGRYAVATPTAYATYPAADQMNCDSCHQPHNTDVDGGTYVLETNAGGTALTGAGRANVTLYGYTFTAVRYPSGGAGLNYTTFCGLCHTSGF